MDICDIANNVKKAIDIANEVKNVELKEVILNLNTILIIIQIHQKIMFQTLPKLV